MKHTAGPGPNQRLAVFCDCLAKNPSSSSPSLMHPTSWGQLCFDLCWSRAWLILGLAHAPTFSLLFTPDLKFDVIVIYVCCLHQTWSLTLSSFTSAVCTRPEVWRHRHSKSVIHLPCRLQISRFQGCKISIMTSDDVQWNVYGAQPCSSDKTSAAVICSSMANCQM